RGYWSFLGSLDFLLCRGLRGVRLIGIGALPARFFEVLIHSVGEDFVFAIAEFALGIEAFKFSAGGLEGVLAMFLEVQNLAGEAREDVEESGVLEGIFQKLLF